MLEDLYLNGYTTVIECQPQPVEAWAGAGAASKHGIPAGEEYAELSAALSSASGLKSTVLAFLPLLCTVEASHTRTGQQHDRGGPVRLAQVLIRLLDPEICSCFYC